MTVHVKGNIPQEEIERYKARAAEKYGDGCTHLYISADGEYVDITYNVVPFERIRRITGYLTGTVDRWNDAKRAELRDRVKHMEVISEQISVSSKQ